MSKEIVITGKVEAYPGSGGSKNSKWGQITGDIADQLDLIKELNTKENNDTEKIRLFFELHPEFSYKFLISIANQPVTDASEFIELLLDYFREHTPVAWIPYEVGKMCLILKVNSSSDNELFKFYIPLTGEIVSVTLTDPSGLVKFTYSFIGNDSETAKWGHINGDIKDQLDLGTDFVGSDSNITDSEIEDLFG